MDTLSVFNDIVELGSLWPFSFVLTFSKSQQIMKQGYETSPIVYSDRPVDKYHGRSLDNWGKVREGVWRDYLKALNTKQSSIRQNKLKTFHLDFPLFPASAPPQYSAIFQSQERLVHATVTNLYWNLNGPTKVYFLLIELCWTSVLHVMTDQSCFFCSITLLSLHKSSHITL